MMTFSALFLEKGHGAKQLFWKGIYLITRIDSSFQD
jgi:hypothetical protein